MAVYKYRDVRDMPDRSFVDPTQPGFLPSLIGFLRAGLGLAPVKYPAGVYKHRSIADLNAQTDQWHRRHIERIKRGDAPLTAGAASRRAPLE